MTIHFKVFNPLQLLSGNSKKLGVDQCREDKRNNDRNENNPRVQILCYILFKNHRCHYTSVDFILDYRNNTHIKS